MSFLLDALAIVTGNLDAPGGTIFGTGPVQLEDLLHRIGADSYDTYRSRIGNFPEILGTLPASIMAEEITTPGPGQIRALFVSSGNPVLSVPNGPELEEAMQELDLMVAIDLYVTETSRHADYILPGTTFLERDDFPAAFLTFTLTPFVQWTDPVVAPRGEARQEWEIIDEISRRIGTTPASVWLLRALGRIGIRLSPERLIDLGLRLGPRGDLFGLRRGGLSLGKLRRHPHGIKLGEHHPTGVLRKKLFHRDKRVHLDSPLITDEVRSMVRESAAEPSAEFPLRMIGMRELRSHNSWMHNVPKLMAGDRVHTARIHPDDAGEHGIEDGAPCRVVSAAGVIELPAKLTDEVMRGVIAIPHGWGHRSGGGWRTADSAGGANVNRLASSASIELERLAGMAFLNGIPVRLEAVPTEANAESEASVAASSRSPRPELFAKPHPSIRSW